MISVSPSKRVFAKLCLSNQVSQSTWKQRPTPATMTHACTLEVAHHLRIGAIGNGVSNLRVTLDKKNLISDGVFSLTFFQANIEAMETKVII